MNNTKCLNSLKGFAACIVAFVWHYQHFAPQQGSPFYSLMPFSYQYGWLMVELFFMLSGFGMKIGYGDKVLSHVISFKAYMLKRLGKIYPIFFLTLILVTILEMIYKLKVGETFVYPNFDVYHFVLNLLCIQNGILGTEWSFNSPSWCISICLFLYSIFYLIIYFSKDRNSVIYKFVVMAIVGAAVLVSGVNYPILNSLMARGLVCFSIGVILAEIYVKREQLNTQMIGYVSLTAIVAIYLLIRHCSMDTIGNLQMLFIIGIAPMIILSTLFVPWLNKLLQFTPFTYLGVISISIYLFHFPVQCAIKIVDVYFDMELNYSSRRIWILYAFITLVVSSVYKMIVEKEYNKLLKSIFIK